MLTDPQKTELKQKNLFGPSLNISSRLKGSLRQAVKSSRFSREEICDRMNERAAAEGLGGVRGKKISVAALDGWLAESKGNMVPVELLPLFCWAAESILPLQVLASPCEVEIIGQRQATRLKAAEIDDEIRRLNKRRRKLLTELDHE